MNKETVLEVFFKQNASNSEIKQLHNENKQLFQQNKLQPANFEQCLHESTSSSDMNTSRRRDTSKSFNSEFSQITLNKSAYDKIAKNPSQHDIFLTIDKDNAQIRKWFIRERTDKIKGPFTGIQMNDLFKLGHLTPDTFVRDDLSVEFYPLKLIVRKYYKMLVAEGLDPKTSVKKERSKRASCFVFKQNMNLETRKQRVLSQEIKPNLYFLDNIAEEESGSEDEPIVTRNRSYTTNNR